MYLCESVSEGGTGNTGTDNDDVGVGATNVATFSVGGAVFVALFFWKSLLLQLPFIGIVITTNNVEKNEPEEGSKEGPDHVLIDHNHCLVLNQTMRPK